MLLWHFFFFFFFYVSSMLNPFLKLFFPPILAFSCLFFLFLPFCFFFFLENRTFTLDTASGMWERRGQLPVLDNFRPSITIFHFPRVLLALFFRTSQPLSTALDLLPRERAILSSRIASCVRYRVSFPFPFPKKTHEKNLDKFSRSKKTRKSHDFVQ